MSGSLYYESGRLKHSVLAPQKCDAKRPCTTCVNANRATECECDISGASSGPSDHPPFIFWNEHNLSGSRDAHRRRVVGGVDSEPTTDSLPAVTTTQLQPRTGRIPPARMLIRSLSHIPPDPRLLTLNEVRIHSFPQVALPHFSAISSLIIPSILPESPFASSSAGAGKFQLSDVALEDLNMKLYVPRVVDRRRSS